MCFKCGTKGHIAKNCETAPLIVRLHNEHGERHHTHTTHVEQMEMSHDKISIDPFGDMESHVVSLDTKPYTLKYFFVTR